MLHIVYTTFSNEASASILARDLIRNKLAACVNVMAPHQSFYQWQGEFCESREVALWCKTSAPMVDDAIAYIRAHHPYETPCILAWQASHCEGTYEAWVTQGTQAP